ncbi:hypothetical protein BJ878DRAFT_75292 [Calycina marina]|uniref:Uncharacterized protein n=1 Tax=Calycina marina TaxID=1763456 RepID=A0A9P8CF31_9HELO|nr:hypothetical protein BJ878DRAFT_75292 [Calycina marina]
MNEGYSHIINSALPPSMPIFLCFSWIAPIFFTSNCFPSVVVSLRIPGAHCSSFIMLFCHVMAELTISKTMGTHQWWDDIENEVYRVYVQGDHTLDRTLQLMLDAHSFKARFVSLLFITTHQCHSNC